MFVSYQEWLGMRKKILDRIKPTEEEHAQVKAVADELVNSLNQISPDDIVVMLTGSFAKGTYIKGDVDFDIFVLFPSTYSLEELQEKTFDWAKSLLDKWEIAYAQHPYIRGYYKGHKVDIVPSYKIEGDSIHDSKIKSAVDRTQLHTRYILSHMTDSQKDDVRILKKFLKRIGVYGAEIKTGGFSGYLCELLVLKYGSFYELIKHSREWKFPVAIDMAGKRSERLLRVLFKDSPFIVTDPVDKKRNVAAPVSADSLARFVAAIHVFFMDPSTDMFFDELVPMEVSEIKTLVKTRGSHIVLMSMPAPDKSPDILWGEIRRTLKNIGISFEIADFRLVHSTAEVENGEIHLLFELENGRLSNVKVHPGPYVRLGQHVERFIKEDANAVDLFVKDERLWAVRKRKIVTAMDLIADVQGDPLKHGVSKGLLEEIKHAKIFENESAISENTRMVFTKHLNRKFYLGLS